MSLTFQALDVYLHEDYGRPSTEFTLVKPAPPSEPLGRRSSLKIRLVPDLLSRLVLATGESFREMEGSLELVPSDELRPIASANKNLNQIGYIQYFEGDDSDGVYVMYALIPRLQFNDLVKAMHNGQVPLFITVDIEGFNWRAELEWDNKANSFLPMVSIKFLVAVAVFPRKDLSDNSDREQFAELMPATKGEVRAALEATAILMKRLSNTLTWATWLIAALVAIALLGFH